MIRNYERAHGVSTSSTFTVGDRVFVFTPDDHKVRRKFPLKWMTSGCIETVSVGKIPANNLYRLRWISPGLQGEVPGTVSQSLYAGSQLKPVPARVPDTALRKLAFTNSTTDDGVLPSQTEPQEQEVYEVERVIALREADDGREYLIKWAGYGVSDCTWVPEYVNSMCLRNNRAYQAALCACIQAGPRTGR